ncbi:hypothetical protein GIB67_003216 [Kingdonia uniflora]|uniref:Sister chromatid cohesion 1 protein 3 n=1 Tax=Kingdonia uniflora TaxID=39325 RepID=A0A7J7LGT3_9MAGN|nr:hypothetical protein GIB67_003216 [Kingdonia uniflora]
MEDRGGSLSDCEGDPLKSSNNQPQTLSKQVADGDECERQNPPSLLKIKLMAMGIHNWDRKKPINQVPQGLKEGRLNLLNSTEDYSIFGTRANEESNSALAEKSNTPMKVLCPFETCNFKSCVLKCGNYENKEGICFESCHNGSIQEIGEVESSDGGAVNYSSAPKTDSAQLDPKEGSNCTKMDAEAEWTPNAVITQTDNELDKGKKAPILALPAEFEEGACSNSKKAAQPTLIKSCASLLSAPDRQRTSSLYLVGCFVGKRLAYPFVKETLTKLCDIGGDFFRSFPHRFAVHNFLARKSPLGTVWIAAHLQKNIRKSHVVDVDIPKSVDAIMVPAVPIALRLAAHLMFGVVRIYSRKTDYLFQECTELFDNIRLAFASIREINLPDDANCAPFQSITLPDNFELDELDLDTELAPDNHLRSQEEITLPDPIPVGGDSFVSVFIGDINMNISPPADIPEFRVSSMQEDTSPVVESVSLNDADPGPSNQAEQFKKRRLFEDFPEIEVRRDAVHESGFPYIAELDSQTSDIPMEIESENAMNKQPTLSPILELPLPELSPQSHLHANPVAFFPSANSLGNFGSPFSLGDILPPLAIAPTPISLEKKKGKSRKRKQLFDESVVLTNEFIKEGLKDASKLVKRRKKLPCSDLDLWRFSKKPRMEQMFLEPIIGGMAPGIQNIFKKEFISSMFCVLPEGDVSSEPRIVSPAPMNPDIEIEHPQNENSHVDNSFFNDLMPSPRRDEFTPIPASNLGSKSRTEILPTLETEPATYEHTASTVQIGSDIETPFTHLEEQPGFDLSDIQELQNSAEAKELDFLEVDNIQSGLEENEEANTLSARTRAVAQYLKNKSPATESSKDQPVNLSLQKILDGKTKKKCARMFYETMVLKTYQVIDVHQEKPYGDITLKIMKGKI